MTKKNANLREENKTPFFTPQLAALLVLVAALSALGGYLYRSQQLNKTENPTLKNPNVVPLKPVPKEEYVKQPLSPEHRYIMKYVHPYISKHQNPLKDCYFGYRGPKKLPEKGAKVTIQIFIAKDGSVEKAEIFSSELQIKPILECILNQVRQWKFEPHTFKKPLRMQYPFFFR